MVRQSVRPEGPRGQRTVAEKLDSMYRQRTTAEGFGEANTVSHGRGWLGRPIGGGPWLSDRAAYGGEGHGKAIGQYTLKAMGEGLRSPHCRAPREGQRLFPPTSGELEGHSGCSL